MAYALTLIRGVLEHRTEIDDLIQEAAHNWKLERLAAVDRNILRVAIYEMLFEDDVPPGVAINEAIETGKKFSTAQSGSFLNGVLDRIRTMRSDPPPSS